MKNHLRTTMLAGLFAVVPVVVTIAVLIYVENLTNDSLTELLGRRIPGLGMLLCVVVTYFVGLLVTSVLGKWIVGKLDALLRRLPVVKDLYGAWKQISYTPGGGEGIYGKLLLSSGNYVPDELIALKGDDAARTVSHNAVG